LRAPSPLQTTSGTRLTVLLIAVGLTINSRTLTKPLVMVVTIAMRLGVQQGGYLVVEVWSRPLSVSSTKRA
jgi:hypothetical protein